MAVRLTLGLMGHWLFVMSLLLGLLLGLPFLAPVLMHIGWTLPARAIYDFCSLFCHQMAQRSFFLFGPQTMFDVTQFPIALSGKLAADIQAFRVFAGNDKMGWKVAWSDRMVYMYGAVWLASSMAHCTDIGQSVHSNCCRSLC